MQQWRDETGLERESADLKGQGYTTRVTQPKLGNKGGANVLVRNPKKLTRTVSKHMDVKLFFFLIPELMFVILHHTFLHIVQFL